MLQHPTRLIRTPCLSPTTSAALLLLCVECALANKRGATGRPANSSGLQCLFAKASRKIASKMGLLEVEASFYRAPVPLARNGERILVDLPFRLPHEIFGRELRTHRQEWLCAGRSLVRGTSELCLHQFLGWGSSSWGPLGARERNCRPGHGQLGKPPTCASASWPVCAWWSLYRRSAGNLALGVLFRVLQIEL